MLTKKQPGSAEWTDPDDAPEPARDTLERAGFFKGDQVIRRGRGRPRSDAPKEQVDIRLDQDVPERLWAAGPGWQTRINTMLRASLGLDRQALGDSGAHPGLFS